MSLPLPEPLVKINEFVDFLSPRDKDFSKTTSWDSGGVGVSDPSEGLFSYSWRASTDGYSITLKREGENPVVIYEGEDISELDFTFDQNMKICLCFVSSGTSVLRWYDTSIDDYTNTPFEGIRNPRVSLDDKRNFNIVNSDIIFAYLKGNDLCFRMQQERYSVERVLETVPLESELLKIGMSKDNRFRFSLQHPE